MYKPSNENDRIEYLATEDPRNKTADGIHVGMTIADAEKILGKLSELSACWGTESGSFSKAPAEFRFAFKGTDGMAGDYGTKELSWQECTKTDKYSEGAIISLISVSKPKKKE
ncbi:MAG: hypothetical protein HKN33_01955 [Pyrinomonadaceae bacterium]|nr:hypothetical protein [Pyrinomonadaceae bacterium]